MLRRATLTQSAFLAEWDGPLSAVLGSSANLSAQMGVIRRMSQIAADSDEESCVGNTAESGEARAAMSTGFAETLLDTLETTLVVAAKANESIPVVDAIGTLNELQRTQEECNPGECDVAYNSDKMNVTVTREELKDGEPPCGNQYLAILDVQSRMDGISFFEKCGLSRIAMRTPAGCTPI